jgi:hypothetical protein
MNYGGKSLCFSLLSPLKCLNFCVRTAALLVNMKILHFSQGCQARKLELQVFLFLNEKLKREKYWKELQKGENN